MTKKKQNNTSFLSLSIFVLSFIVCFSNSNISFSAQKQIDKTNNKQTKNKKTLKNSVRTGDDMEGIPEFPNEKEVYYEQLFDDGFTNSVESYPIISDYGDNFVGNLTSKKINKKYIAGNENNISQMDAVEAEKVNFVDGVKIDKDLVSTERTRVMAYLTQNQIIMDEMFEVQPHTYFLSEITNDND